MLMSLEVAGALGLVFVASMIYFGITGVLCLPQTQSLCPLDFVCLSVTSDLRVSIVAIPSFGFLSVVSSC